MSNLLVSVITPTIPDRYKLLIEAMRNLREQTYPNIEHVIVIEGEGKQADAFATTTRHESIAMRRHIPTRVVALGQHWTSELPESHAAAPMIVGQFMARGFYQTWLADDERMTPDHIASLVELCETAPADFAYSQTEMHMKDRPDQKRIIGADPPSYGFITNCLYRRELLSKAGPFRTHTDANDWDQIRRFMMGGARWAFLPKVTLTHRADR